MGRDTVALGQIVQRIAGIVIGMARSALIKRCRLGMLGRGGKRQHAVGDRPVIAPFAQKSPVKVNFGRSVGNMLQTVFRQRNPLVEPFDFLNGIQPLLRTGGQQGGGLGGPEIRGEVIEVAEILRVGEINVADVGSGGVIIGQPPETQRAQHDHQQKAEEEGEEKAESDRLSLRHRRDSPPVPQLRRTLATAPCRQQLVNLTVSTAAAPSLN